MHWLSLFFTKAVSEGFPTSFDFSRGLSQWAMLTVLIKAYCVNVVVDIKPIYLNKRYLFQNKTYYLDKIYFCFAKIKLSKHTRYKLNWLNGRLNSRPGNVVAYTRKTLVNLVA